MNKQTQNAIKYQDILVAVKEKHDKFIGKFSGAIEKALSDLWMEQDLTYARLFFIAKILKDAKVINHYEEIAVIVEGTTFNRSIALSVNHGTAFVYMLNSGRNVFVYEGVALEHPGNLSFLVWSQNDQTKKYSDVLNDDFNWKDFSLYVTDVIHKSSYRRKAAIENIIG